MASTYFVSDFPVVFFFFFSKMDQCSECSPVSQNDFSHYLLYTHMRTQSVRLWYFASDIIACCRYLTEILSRNTKFKFPNSHNCPQLERIVIRSRNYYNITII